MSGEPGHGLPRTSSLVEGLRKSRCVVEPLATRSGRRRRSGPWRASQDLLLVFGPCPHVLYVEDARHPVPKAVTRMSKFGPDPLVLYVEPVTATKESPMHHHVPRCQRPEPARRCCGQHGLAGRGRRWDPASAGPPSGAGTSRIGPPATREARAQQGAGQGTSPASVRDPDWWGRTQSVLLRLIGGRR